MDAAGLCSCGHSVWGFGVVPGTGVQAPGPEWPCLGGAGPTACGRGGRRSRTGGRINPWGGVAPLAGARGGSGFPWMPREARLPTRMGGLLLGPCLSAQGHRPSPKPREATRACPRRPAHDGLGAHDGLPTTGWVPMTACLRWPACNGLRPGCHHPSPPLWLLHDRHRAGPGLGKPEKSPW